MSISELSGRFPEVKIKVWMHHNAEPLSFSQPDIESNHDVAVDNTELRQLQKPGKNQQNGHAAKFASVHPQMTAQEVGLQDKHHTRL